MDQRDKQQERDEDTDEEQGDDSAVALLLYGADDPIEEERNQRPEEETDDQRDGAVRERVVEGRNDLGCSQYHRQEEHIREGDQLDEAQMAAWVKQAAALPGWVPGQPS